MRRCDDYLNLPYLLPSATELPNIEVRFPNFHHHPIRLASRASVNRAACRRPARSSRPSSRCGTIDGKDTLSFNWGKVCQRGSMRTLIRVALCVLVTFAIASLVKPGLTQT